MTGAAAAVTVTVTVTVTTCTARPSLVLPEPKRAGMDRPSLGVLA
ncbi:hypothetical protein BFJ63_vAg3804 [Fusarium oxysporum f. sp. narcissi]|uniref:Uncharacterized protein n=2 Tax=Fusarium oxysporum TaxID=5507 RepID=A0A4Q2W1U3_FUSOX|nr:hypothetical protein BFJ65_g9 [Fusarium oxysporum f. sp. cepae]RKL02558.1 hypothetical protein BFJ71_g4592 [Fusarium oxysporum]RYC93496.1 hypothetical protein BFJ63_vAg3804 [Fusarium oxysporum f. sp. narcissi]RKK60944.1 hypothetical protein BFJ66_g1549 [Fusarium oxysporum f. sp. cepae]RKK62729.1 hypothetical protein BFJ67_g1170 [Fusarium oxysporum f. sp. cepae]